MAISIITTYTRKIHGQNVSQILPVLRNNIDNLREKDQLILCIDNTRGAVATEKLINEVNKHPQVTVLLTKYLLEGGGASRAGTCINLAVEKARKDTLLLMEPNVYVKKEDLEKIEQEVGNSVDNIVGFTQKEILPFTEFFTYGKGWRKEGVFFNDAPDQKPILPSGTVALSKKTFDDLYKLPDEGEVGDVLTSLAVKNLAKQRMFVQSDRILTFENVKGLVPQAFGGASQNTLLSLAPSSWLDVWPPEKLSISLKEHQEWLKKHPNKLGVSEKKFMSFLLLKIS